MSYFHSLLSLSLSLCMCVSQTNNNNIMVRAPVVDKDGVKRGAWSLEEDQKLRAYIEKYGPWKWREVPRLAGT